MRITFDGELLRQAPLARAVLFVIAGIFLADAFEFPIGILCAAFILCGALAALLLRRGAGAHYLAASLLLLGVIAGWLHRPEVFVPRDRRAELAIDVVRPPLRGEASGSGEGRVCAWRDEEGRWRAASDRVVIHADTSVTLYAGVRIVCRTSIRPFRRDSTGYARSMARRGYAGSVWVGSRNMLDRDSMPVGGFRRATERMHAAAADRMRRLHLQPDREALCLAMAVGERTSVPQTLRAAYARSGIAHLLAVSGLHVGIVFLVVNALLFALPLLRNGHLLRSLLAVAAMWGYAMTTGFSPSTVRAVLMFTALQCALLTTSVYVSLNVLSGAALVMLLGDPGLLFDAGFRLSFLAVAGILLWALPLYPRLRTPYRAVNALTGSMLTALSATLATAPLLSNTFGYVSLAGLLLNPAALLLSTAIVALSILWIVAPVPLLAPLFRLVLDAAAGWQNALASHAAALPAAAVDWRLSDGSTAALYVALFALTVVCRSVERKKSVLLSR